MYFRAILQASRVIVKPSAGDDTAMTTVGHSPLRPNKLNRRSDCSGLVDRPTDGPACCTATTTSGNSVITAKPMASDLRTKPLPLEAVTPRQPPKAAPTAAPDRRSFVLSLKDTASPSLEFGQTVQQFPGCG
jgi:hypothetical protein